MYYAIGLLLKINIRNTLLGYAFTSLVWYDRTFWWYIWPRFVRLKTKLIQWVYSIA